ncbi:MAG: transporter [Clostridiales bacterium]|uniref:YkvI family membrane protein n=1 Tax=Clostridium sp. N3C TaxID=1776758 RepID=UPI00092DF9CE|nr:transporter [Clostridium sp. N3C]NLZ48884.1 transporter [Clostridiales bacterium]SCN24204.1 putative membrane protein [Clostridium sp. N3C]
MKKNLSAVFQVAAVFIGTIVGAGLASGKEITQFFTTYGYKSFVGIILCGIIYIGVSKMFIEISTKYKLESYNELINLISPGFLGKLTDLFTSFFLLSGAAIILAGSGALLNQYFGISKWVGIALMASLAFIILMRDTNGLIEVNSIIVPSLIFVITSIFVLYVVFSKDLISYEHIKSIPYSKKHWFLSTILYAGFNLLSCSGVLVPLSKEINHNKTLIWGVSIGAFGLTLLCAAINLLLMLNVPYIYKYEIPLLYIAHRFGSFLQIMLLFIIWLEMFSTVVSDVYSVSKMLQSLSDKNRSHGGNYFKSSLLTKFLNYITYKKSVALILLIALPISQVGFSNLIKVLYPFFGVISTVFIIQCTIFYVNNKVYEN